MCGHDDILPFLKKCGHKIINQKASVAASCAKMVGLARCDLTFPKEE
jgi:hypothetical protein